MNELVSIIYFSGTGGTKRIADTFEKQLLEHFFTTYICPLDYSVHELNYIEIDKKLLASKFILLIFPVYGFDAPNIIFEWINHTGLTGKDIVVISVSGGGEVWPNTSSRIDCNTALENKGFRIIYEKMMVMPANVLVNINDHLAMHLINALPEKVEKILQAILAGKIRRTTPNRKDVFQSFAAQAEKKETKKLAKSFIITDSCTQCRWCEKNCPVKNIKFESQKPVFAESCLACLRCIYGCPHHAITLKSSIILKQGYNLNAVEKRMENVELLPIDQCCKGFLLRGVKDYLFDKDGYE